MGYLNQYTRRRVAAVLLVVGIVVGVLALTDAPPLFDDPPTPEELVEEATSEFFAAGASEEYVRACAQLTKASRETIERQFAALGTKEDVAGCPSILELVAKDVFGDLDYEVIEVSVSGPTARIEIKQRLEGQGRLQRSIQLQEESPGRWKISELSVY
jgi:hypothetical protein